jgi:hypothetical protein
MGWPESEDSPYLWREGGEPARQAYANVAKAISQFEPLFMIANPGEPAANARKVPPAAWSPSSCSIIVCPQLARMMCHAACDCAKAGFAM